MRHVKQPLLSPPCNLQQSIQIALYYLHLHSIYIQYMRLHSTKLKPQQALCLTETWYFNFKNENNPKMQPGQTEILHQCYEGKYSWHSIYLLSNIKALHSCTRHFMLLVDRIRLHVILVWKTEWGGIVTDRAGDCKPIEAQSFCLYSRRILRRTVNLHNWEYLSKTSDINLSKRI